MASQMVTYAHKAAEQPAAAAATSVASTADSEQDKMKKLEELARQKARESASVPLSDKNVLFVRYNDSAFV